MELLFLQIIPADPQSLDFLGMALIFLSMPLSMFVLMLIFKKRFWRIRIQESRRVKGMALQRELARLEIRANAREQIAADLHDALGLYFSMIVIGLRENIKKTETEAKADLPRLIGLCDTYHHEVQTLLQELRSPDVFPKGLAGALKTVLYYFEQQGHFVLETSVPAVLPVLSRDQEVFLLCIVKECLHNIVKHAAAECVNLTLTISGSMLRLTVLDDGQGFDPDGKQAGNGLRNIRERVELLQGRVRIRSGPQTGTEISVEIPI